MYENYEEQRTKQYDKAQLLEEFSFSQYYAELQRILIECIEEYGESIMTLFGLDSLVMFINQIDKVSKEKGTQIIEHFILNCQIENLMSIHLDETQTLSSDQEFEIDLLCDELSNFSYYYQNYRIYILNFLYKQMENQTGPEFESIQRLLDFPKIDELMGQYIILERLYIKNAMTKGIANDNKEFINLIKNQL